LGGNARIPGNHDGFIHGFRPVQLGEFHIDRAGLVRSPGERKRHAVVVSR
jgi:hypothetical protein